MRRFNTAGPCRPEHDYMIPPARRLPRVVELVDRQAYFALYAPRQSGKTTIMRTLAQKLTNEGRYAALHFTCEEARVFPEDISAAEKVVVSSLHARAACTDCQPHLLRDHPPGPRRAGRRPGDGLHAKLPHARRRPRHGSPPSRLRRVLARARRRLRERSPYPEVAPQLVLMAWLHRIVNGGDLIDREVGVGRKRIDLLVRWPITDAAGKRAVQRFAIELKVWRDRDKRRDPVAQGLTQLDDYLASLDLDEGTLIVFDARSTAPPIEDRTRFEEVETPSGRKVTLLRA